MRNCVNTPHAPQAIGCYSQAVRCGDLLFVSGQIPLDPKTGEVVVGDNETVIRRALDNLLAICKAENLDFSFVIKINIYVTDLSMFSEINSIMETYFKAPYPARAVVEVSALPKGVSIECDAVISYR